MMLSGGEVAVKLAGSAAKNAAAMLLALARNHKKVYGKTSLKKILQQTRDIRTFSLTPEQYREFSRMMSCLPNSAWASSTFTVSLAVRLDISQ